MINVSYNVSAPILQTLQEIEAIRAQILLVPLSLEQSAKLEWKVEIDRIFFGLQLSGTPIIHQQIDRLLTSSNEKAEDEYYRSIFDYKKAFDLIKYDWFVQEKPITQKDLIYLNKLSSRGKLKTTPQEIDWLLQYMQYSQENPIIQAALGHILLLSIEPFATGNTQTIALFTYLILYRYGYNFRGLINLEKFWYSAPKAYQYTTTTAQKTGQLNIWLDYFVNGVLSQLKETLTLIKSPQPIANNSPFHLNGRQKQILALLEKPKYSLTNRDVQKLFTISQITASRDLSELAKLGLIRQYGQGRSVYYTKY